MPYSQLSDIVKSIGEVLLSSSAYRMSNCVVFFVCVQPPYPIMQDVKGFYHTPYTFDSVDDAEKVLSGVVATCSQVFLITKPVNPEFRVSTIINILNSLEILNLDLKGTSYNDREFLAIKISASQSKDEKRRILGTLMILNSKGYLGESQNFKKSSRNVITVM